MVMYNMDMSLYDLNRDIIQGRAKGRVLWQPRIQCWFHDRDFLNIPYERPYTGLSHPDIYRKLGCSNRIYLTLESYYTHDAISFIKREIDELRWEEIIETPVGKISCVQRRNRLNYGIFPEKWFVESEDDLKVLIYIQEHTAYSFDKDSLDNCIATIGDTGLPCGMLPRTSIQRLFVEYMGVEGAIHALVDYPDTVEEYFGVCEESDKLCMDAYIESGIEWLNFGDNIHGGILSPKLFVKYILPYYQRRNDYLHKYNIFTHAHWDGDCKPLLPYMKDTGLDGIEAITPIPQGDISLAEAKKAMGDMYMIDGIAALLFDELYPLEMLMNQVKECIDLFPDRLIMGISDELSSTGTLERVKKVADYVNEYNARIG